MFCQVFTLGQNLNELRDVPLVLPSFEVKLILESPFFYTDSEELTVDIKATYA